MSRWRQSREGQGAEGGRRPRSEADSPLLANLAAAPFLNQRPVQRFALAAWVLGALLLGINVLLWVQYRHESTALRDRLAETRAAIDAAGASVVGMDQELAGLRLPAQNAQVAFLNDRIAERTFPWSLLFERIAATLPDGVRLMSLTPVFSDRSEGGPRTGPKVAPEDEVISLKLRGAAKDDDSLYQLMDAFFAAPVFARPRLFQESSSGGEVSFAVDVDYRPRFIPAADSGAAAAADATAAPGDDAAAELAPAAAPSEGGAAFGIAGADALIEDVAVDQHEVSE